MNKLNPLLKLSLSLAVFVNFVYLPQTQAKPNPQTKTTHSIWLSFPFWNLSSLQKLDFIKYLASKKINHVYLSVYDNGVARWESKVLANTDIAASKSNRELNEVVGQFRQNGIEVGAFFEWGPAVSINTEFFKKNQGRFQRCGTTYVSGEHGGSLYAFLDPSQKKNRKLITAMLKELALHPVHFKEIQLDRFRYTVDPKWKMCTASDGTSNPEYINQLVAESSRAIRLANPKITVSASPVGSYGFWKHHQDWGTWLAKGWVDQVSVQAYIPSNKLSDCVAGTPITPDRKTLSAIFKGELASLLGKPQDLESAVNELISVGGNPADLELADRRPMVLARAKSLQNLREHLQEKIIIGYMAYQYDDSECVLDHMKIAAQQGFLNATLWVSEVAPETDGKPQKSIADNLELLGKTLWKD